MAAKTLQQTTVQADVLSTDILGIARGSGPLSNVVVSALVTFLKAGTGGIGSFFLQAANNLSDLANAATARTNLGVQPSVAPSFTGGMTLTGGLGQTGGTVQNVDALGALNIDWSAADFHTKSISANSTFTFSGITAAKAQGAILQLIISSSATTTWPASVKWAAGAAPTLGNGTHVIGLVTFDGGTTVDAMVGGIAFA